MMKRRFFLTMLACGATLVAAVGCSSDPLPSATRYWERALAKESTLLEGPKVQQMLHRDYSRCVVELRELEMLGAVRPEEECEKDEEEESASADRLDEWGTPVRDDEKKHGYPGYRDFESCMTAKGWKRMERQPYKLSERDPDEYVDSIGDQKYRTQSGACDGRDCVEAAEDDGDE